jgi:hypothetical protein
MVGVPGKSKGCSTCRRRKKGVSHYYHHEHRRLKLAVQCDQKRPSCGQCATGGYLCGGYERERTFIQHPSSKLAERAVYIPYARADPSSLTRSLDRAAIYAQCRALFWNLFMPHGDCVVKDEFILRCGHPMNWTEMVNELPQEETCLESAFSALTLSRVGKDNGDDRFVRQSTKLYGRALKEMQTALYDSDRMHSDEVLTASMILGLYESFENPTLDSRSWLSHAQGAAQLIELRGPERHRNRQAHHVFLGSRVPTIYAAILQRHSTYLAAEAWRTTPWENHHKTYFDHLVDTATEIPGLLEKIDQACSGVGAEKSVNSKADLLHAATKIQSKLDIWKRCVKADGLPREVDHVSRGTDDKYPFATEIHFDNHLFLGAHTLYYCCSLVIANAVDQVCAELFRYEQQSGQDDLTVWTSRPPFDSNEHATAIAQTLPYCMQPSMGSLGSIIIRFPASLSFQHFESRGDTGVVQWMTTIQDQMRLRGMSKPLESSVKHQRRISELESNIQAAKTSAPMIRSDSSSSSEGEFSNSLNDESGRVPVRFVHEDPARSYSDNTGDSS